MRLCDSMEKPALSMAAGPIFSLHFLVRLHLVDQVCGVQNALDLTLELA